MTYRSKLQIMHSIMNTIDATDEGAIISLISRNSNTSHYVSMEHLKTLVESGILKTEQVKQERSGLVATSYQLTQAGKILKLRLDELSSDLKKLNLNIL